MTSIAPGIHASTGKSRSSSSAAGLPSATRSAPPSSKRAGCLQRSATTTSSPSTAQSASTNGSASGWNSSAAGRSKRNLVHAGPFPPAEIAAIGFDVCRALAPSTAPGCSPGRESTERHARRGGRVVLMDFGTGLDPPTGRSHGPRRDAALSRPGSHRRRRRDGTERSL